MSSRPILTLFALLALFVASVIAPPSATAADPETVGGEFLLDPLDQGSPTRIARARLPDLAMIPGGTLIAVWEDAIEGLSGRRLDWTGETIGPSFSLVANDPIPGIPFNGVLKNRKEVSLVSEPAGFVLFWTEETVDLTIDVFSETRILLDRNVIGQRFDRDGNPRGPAFAVHGSAPGFQGWPQAVRFGRSGQMLVVWESRESGSEAGDGIFARVVDRFGEPQGNAFKLDTASTGSRRPTVAGNLRGGFLVAWEGCCDEAGSTAIFGYSASLRDPEAGGSGQINEQTVGNQRVPVVAARRDGGYWVAWQSPTDETDDEFRVYARAVVPGLAFTGSGDEMIVSSGPGWAHSSPAIAAGLRNQALVAWMRWEGDFRTGVSAVRLGGDGVFGEDFSLSESPPDGQFRLGLAGSRGVFIAAWEGFDVSGEAGLLGRVVSPLGLDPPARCGEEDGDFTLEALLGLCD